jgi:diadenosine tetraphosphate (Ap4A) HIT family hydrolase
MAYIFALQAVQCLTSFCTGVTPDTSRDSCSEVVVYEGKKVKLTVPERPLAAGSVQIKSKKPFASLTDIKEECNLETYEVIQDIVSKWKECGITDYLIYAKDTNGSQDNFRWEIVPYKKEGFRLWKQFKVLWNITFGGPRISTEEKKRTVKVFEKIEGANIHLQSQGQSINELAHKKDAFCDPNVIKKQIVYEGKKIRVLYNYAPIAIGEEKLHFLIVPKEHRLTFTDLTKEEYQETIELSQKLISFYRNKGYNTAYIFDKSGPEAGQTVPHWHEHLVVTATKTHEFFAKLIVLKNMLFGSSPIPPAELESRVKMLHKELAIPMASELYINKK